MALGEVVVGAGVAGPSLFRELEAPLVSHALLHVSLDKEPLLSLGLLCVFFSLFGVKLGLLSLSVLPVVLHQVFGLRFSQVPPRNGVGWGILLYVGSELRGTERIVTGYRVRIRLTKRRCAYTFITFHFLAI